MARVRSRSVLWSFGPPVSVWEAGVSERGTTRYRTASIWRGGDGCLNKKDE